MKSRHIRTIDTANLDDDQIQALVQKLADDDQLAWTRLTRYPRQSARAYALYDGFRADACGLCPPLVLGTLRKLHSVMNALGCDPFRYSIEPVRGSAGA